MPRIQVNPNAEANAGFDVAQPAIYTLRIEGSPKFPAIQEFTSSKGNQCLKVRLVFVDPTSVITLKGDTAKNLGSIIDQSITTSTENQGKLRSLVESCGIDWSSWDGETEGLIGQEVQAKVGTESYKGEMKNVIERYLKPGSN